jgi:predicted metal-dependent phosphoesterase TrpH
MHSTFSDGTYTPKELVLLGKRQKTRVMSLTDHDTVSGVPRFLRECTRQGLRGIAGVELSAQAPYTLHILGYAFDPTSDNLAKKLETLRQAREERNVHILEKLEDLNMPLTLEEVLREAGDEVIGRPHFAKAMVRRGYVRSTDEAFARYLERGKPAYASRDRLSPEECLRLIREARGVPVLAHPIQTKLDDQELEILLKKLKDQGLWGLESLYAMHTPEQQLHYLRMGDRVGLYPTGGSDFHGNNRTGRSLGVSFEEASLPWARLGVDL